METLQRTANRGSISTGFDIDNSLKIEPDNSESMSRTPSGNGNLKTCTLSVWLKRTELKEGFYFTGDYGGSANPWFILGFNSNEISLSTTAGVSANGAIKTTRLFRDTSAWYHIVVAFDTTQSTASNRVKIYVNGVQETSFSSANYPDQNDDLDIMAAKAQGIGGYNDGTDYRYAGYMSEFVGIDGQALAPTEFGEFNSNSGIWIPKDVSGLTFGTNGFYLDFKDASNLGNDASGGTDFAETNITAVDQATDTPTNNFCTWNPLVTNAGVFTYTEGATKWKPSSGNWQTTTASMGFTKGKWYAEFKMDNNVTAAMVGVQQLENDTTYSGQYLGYYANTTSMGMGYYNADGKVYRNTGESAYGASYPSSVLVSVALEFKDDGTANMYVAKDGTWQNSADPANGTGGFGLNYGSAVDGFFTFASSLYQNPGYWQANFGGYTVNSISSAASDANGYGTFEYAPPSGYYALCTKNLAEYG